MREMTWATRPHHTVTLLRRLHSENLLAIIQQIDWNCSTSKKGHSSLNTEQMVRIHVDIWMDENCRVVTVNKEKFFSQPVEILRAEMVNEGNVVRLTFVILINYLLLQAHQTTFSFSMAQLSVRGNYLKIEMNILMIIQYSRIPCKNFS